MAWRGIHLSRPAYLSVEHRALKLDFRDDDGGTFRIPLEDLAYLILDTPDITLSGRLLAGLAEANTLVLGVDARHLPVWTSLPWTRYHRQGEILNIQLNATVPQKKQLWKRIVETKIKAQARCLHTNNLNGADTLDNIAMHVRSGDPDNTEARAARRYWSHLFPTKNFRRHADDLPNAMLNYAYAILRAAIARQLCATGYIPQLGIHHTSLSNAYNLADDLIEPYRPIADHFVLRVLSATPPDAPFSTDHRRALAQMLECDLWIEDEVYSLLPAIEVTVNSLKTSLQNKEPAWLAFPTFTPAP